jgi:hypothetical protein
MNPLVLVLPIVAIATPVAVAVASLSLSSGAHRVQERPSRSATYVGTTPCGEPVGKLWGLDAGLPCEAMKWTLTLRWNQDTGEPDTYGLVCTYGRPEQGTNALSSGWKTLERNGAWALVDGTAADPRAPVYELSPGAPGSVCLQAISPSVLHLLDAEGRLMLGDAAWSFTLNGTARAGENVAGEQPPKSLPASPRFPVREGTSDPQAKAPAVSFVGRSPCLDEVGRTAYGVEGDCRKLKWDLTLHRDPETLAPRTFRLKGTLFRARDAEGRWRETKGTLLDPEAEVYELTPEAGGPELAFLQLGDLLYFLDDNRTPMIGTADFSYTLNRAEVVGVRPQSPTQR